MVGPGVIPVRIEVIQELSPSLDSQKISVQVGAFAIKRNAEVLKTQLSKTFSDVYIARFKTPHQIYSRVRIKAESIQKANTIALKLQKAGYNVFVLEWQ
jgi:rare lipoprotein A